MPPLAFPLTAAAVAAVLLVLQQVLMITVGAHRGGAKVGAGAAGDATLERKIRRHGNLAENAPIFLLGLALFEMTGAPDLAVRIFGAAFLIARLLHVAAFASEAGSHLAAGPAVFPAMRSVGAVSTALLGIVLGAWLLVRLWPELGL